MMMMMGTFVKLMGFVFFLTLLQGYDQKVLDEENINWLHASKLLTRGKRDIPAELLMAMGEEMENEFMAQQEIYDYYAFCIPILACEYHKHRELYRTMTSFNFGEVYENLDSWCAPRASCWNDSCDDEIVKMRLASNDEVITYMCNHREAFRDTTDCFKPPFSRQMTPCSRQMMEQMHPNSEDFDHDRVAMSYLNCVRRNLDELPGCSSDSEFADFLEIEMNQVLKQIKLEIGTYEMEH